MKPGSLTAGTGPGVDTRSTGQHHRRSAYDLYGVGQHRGVRRSRHIAIDLVHVEHREGAGEQSVRHAASGDETPGDW